ncbi:porin [Paraburkholderia unamae]|uniref:Porin n=1 Tax=Paraburkholderia unamae TaxID=219649 RepID=A0ABX5KUF3_9BURK|nr:porin [Paraburkholderia unamae]PVX85894.1 putative porin [Paraburkholderia unamae]
MNRRICLALIFVSGGAYAQSSVTLWGRLDAGVQYLTGVAAANGSRSNLFSMDSGDAGASAWGMTGVEDIGNGYKINFKLLDYILVTNGMSSNPFWQNAYVGMSGPFGSFRMGRDDGIIKDGTADYDPFYQQHIGMESLVRGANWPNFSNTFSYYSPSFAGFDVGFQYSLSGVPGQFNSGRTSGVQLTYRLGAFSTRAVYQEVRDANGQFSDLFTAQKQFFVGAGFTGSIFKFQAAYTYMAAPQAPASSPRYADYAWGGVTYNALGPLKVILGGAWLHQRNGHGNATLVEIAPTYNLSKRTYLYAAAGYVFNGKNTNFSPVEQPEGSPMNPALGHNQFGLFSGIMHYF